MNKLLIGLLALSSFSLLAQEERTYKCEEIGLLNYQHITAVVGAKKVKLTTQRRQDGRTENLAITSVSNGTLNFIIDGKAGSLSKTFDSEIYNLYIDGMRGLKECYSEDYLR